MVNREVDSTSPPIPAVPSRALAAIPPDTAKPNPVGIPGGVSGIWPISATVLGSYHPSFRGGGSGLGSSGCRALRHEMPPLARAADGAHSFCECHFVRTYSASRQAGGSSEWSQRS